MRDAAVDLDVARGVAVGGGTCGRQAALLLEWRCLDGHYDGRITVAALESDGWAIIEMWVEQGLLSPP